MEETQACRVCLATDVRLYNVHKYGLSENLRSITGFLIQQADGLPQGVCSYCAVSLQKCVAFRTRYHASQCVLNSILERGLILSHHIGTIDRQAKNLTNPLTIHTDHHIIDIQHTENVIKEEVPFKDEENSIDNFELKLDNGVFKAEDDYPFLDSPGNSADDEPLAFRVKREKKVKKSVKKKKKVTLDVKDIQRQTEDANIELVLLSKQEQIDEIQARKESTNYASALFKCDKCFKGFLQETTFKNHMAMHDPSIGPFKCDICSVYCASERRVRAHKKVAHERRYICRLCKNVATTSHYAREHQRWHNGVTYDCKKCDMSFRKSTSYLTHLRLQHPSEYVCDICGASFIGKNGLNTHKLKTHKHDQSTSYLTHLRLQHPSEYVCDICGASFIGKNGLNTHKLKTHKHDQEPDRDLFCEDCELKFRSNEALQRHRETSSHHTKTDQFFKSCLACGSSFDSERALWEHNKTHKTQIEKVKCKECGLVCVFTNYSAHYRKFHLGATEGARRQAAKNYVCEVCGKKCSSNSTLSYHQRSHTGEKPFSCPLCPKRFKVHQLMKIHYRTHTGECPYMCSMCPKAFKHKAALNRHVRVHTGDKPYTCPYCGKSFSQSNSLKTHVNTVHLKLPAPYKRRTKMVD